MTAAPRIATLDILRGVAVMGILAMNIVSFADVPAAYLTPLAQTADLRTGDLVTYAVNFLVFDGKMRGLFSMLFGASLGLLAARMELRLVKRRLGWLLLFGAAHFFLIWYGDILIGYALIGFLALAMRDLSVRGLIGWAIGLLTIQLAMMSATAAWAFSLQAQLAATPTPDLVAQWQAMTRDTGVPDAAHRAKVIALYLGPWSGIVLHQVTEKFAMPLVLTFAYGPETLAYMLLGLAGLKSGLLTGAWEDRRYRRWALICLAIGLPLSLACLRLLFSSDFAVPAIFLFSFALPVVFRPLMVIAYACLIILVARSSGALAQRIAAAGRAAFSNYLGTSVLMTFLFYGWGLGLFASLGRIELAGVVVATAALMLLWSKPWLDRYRYGPAEWLWRSLTFARPQPMRRIAN